MIGVTSIIGTQLADKGKERSDSTKSELQKIERKLNQEFLRDLFLQISLMEGEIKNAFTNFFQKNIENKNSLFLNYLKSFGLKETVEESESNSEKQELPGELL